MAKVQITGKEFNKVEKVVLILGNPDNIENKDHREVEKGKLKPIIDWCKEKNVLICLHNKTDTLEKTLNQFFQSSEENEPVARLSASMS